MALSVFIGGILSGRSLGNEVRAMFDATRNHESDVVSESDLAGLPEPVQRWLRHSNVVGRKKADTVRLKQEGQFRRGENASWMPYTAEEYFTVDPPAFIWNARFKIIGLPLMEARDSYRQGKGTIRIKLGSVIPVGTETGPEMDQGAMLRFLNEIMWFPSAALSDYIEWSPIDFNRAKATMTYKGVTASAVFHIDLPGNMTNMVAERYGNFGDGYSLEEWLTPIQEHGEFHGVEVPVKGQGVWNLESGSFAYIRLNVTDIDYDITESY